MVLEYYQSFLGPFSLLSFILHHPAKQFSLEFEVCSPKIQSSKLVAQPLWCHKDLELLHFMFSAAKVALKLQITHQPLLTDEDKVQNSTSSHGFQYHLEENVIINTYQEPLHCCPSNRYWGGWSLKFFFPCISFNSIP